MRKKTSFRNLIAVLAHRPHACARLSGSKEYPHLTGNVWFYQTEWGVLTAVSVAGLPRQSATGSHRIFGFHIHSGTQCSGTETDLFADVLTHYNPDDQSFLSAKHYLPTIHIFIFYPVLADRSSPASCQFNLLNCPAGMLADRFKLRIRPLAKQR